MEIGDQGYAGQRATNGRRSAADQRGHRSVFDPPRYGEKAPAPSDHDGAFRDSSVPGVRVDQAPILLVPPGPLGLRPPPSRRCLAAR